MTGVVDLGMPAAPGHGMVDPYVITRDGPRRPARLRPDHVVPTLAHIEITYACMESCVMCYNPTRTKVNERDKATVTDIVEHVARQRIPHTYLIGGEPTYGYTSAELSAMVDVLTDNGSSVTIVTNGQIHLSGFNPRLACFGVSIHGATAEGHDAITGKRGSFERALRAVRTYVDDGHDVRFVTVLIGRNHDEMYRIAELAHDLGAESIYFDVYEPGGIGEQNSHVGDLRLEPTVEELRVAIGQIVRAHEEIPIRGGVALGTAVPYCLDRRLVETRMYSSCGMGTTFCAITSTGEVRLCNQSRMTFGNVLRRPLADIWSDPLVDRVFRDLSWVQEPCASCAVLEQCGGGCKVDEGCASGELCIDRLVRRLDPAQLAPVQPSDLVGPALQTDYPEALRTFRISPWLAVTDLYRDRGDLFFKTRYQTVSVREAEFALVRSLADGPARFGEAAFLSTLPAALPRDAGRRFLSALEQVGAIEVEPAHR